MIDMSKYNGRSFEEIIAELEMYKKAMSFDEFSAANRIRCEDPNGFNHMLESWTEADWQVAATGELGEAATAFLDIVAAFGRAANLSKKITRERQNIRGNTETFKELQADLKHELADVVIYLDLYFQRLGASMGDEVRTVWNAKSEQIGYPGRL